MKQKRQLKNHPKPPSKPFHGPFPDACSESDGASGEAIDTPYPIAVPVALAGSGSLDRLVETARDYARQATADNTNTAYAKDWAHYNSWCRRRGANALPPSPELIGLYIASCAAPEAKAPARSARALSVSTIERRLSGIAWHYQQRGFALDRKDRHIATVLAGIRRKHARPPVQKEAVLAEDIRGMVATLGFDLRAL